MKKKLQKHIKMKIQKSLLLSFSALMVFACGRNPNDPGVEYASQMYHAIAYEPYSQILDTKREEYNTIEYNPNKINMRKPAKGTIARKMYAGQPKNELAKELYIYDVHPDSLEYSAKNLTNPIPLSKEVVAEGQVLYNRYCSACHGPGGEGDGKVAEQYKGVANLVAKAKVSTDGHIFHVITHGKGRMWPHGSQVNPEERWKIVHFVKSLGNQ
jgi:mono/diheme cytochrome c family protein